MVGCQLTFNSLSYSQGRFFLRLHKKETKLIAAVAASSVDGAAITLENVSEAAESDAAKQMSVMIIDRF
jgi:hypothetical protein